MTTPTPTSTSASIDELLQHYLALLHTYTTLRSQLASATSALQQHLARANFSSDRGRRYGQDDYDERMQAAVRLDVRIEEPVIEVGTTLREMPEVPSFSISGAAHASADKVTKTQTGGMDEENAEKLGGENAKNTEDAPKLEMKQNAALRQFGILVPPSLRSAQSTAEEMVREVIPRLATVDAEMKAVEIEVRRCRKRARKAEGKAGPKLGMGTEGDLLPRETDGGM